MASISPTKTGFAVKWRLGGKRGGAPQTLTFTIPDGHRPTATRKLAEAAKQLAESRAHNITRDEVRAAILGDTPSAAPAGIPTFAEWVGTYLKMRRESAEAQDDTIDRYEQILASKAMPFLGHRYLTDITPDVIKEWVAWVVRTKRKPNGAPLSAQTVRRAHAILHGCLGAAVPRYLAANPAARPAGARKHIAGLPKQVPYTGMFLEPWEVKAIFSHLNPSVRDMAEVAASTGLRLGELLVLRPTDVVLSGDRRYIDVTRALKDNGSIGPPKSAKSRRQVEISGREVEILTRLMAGKHRDDLIFTSPRGHRWRESNLRRRHWLPAVAAAQRCAEHPPPPPEKPPPPPGVTRKRPGPVRKYTIDEVSTCMCPGRLRRSPRFHDLRHTHVSALIANKWTPKEIQLRVGHASFQITMDVYGHLWERGNAGRLDEVNRMLFMEDDEEA